MTSNNKILLTGASGFAGAHMLKYLYNNTNATIFCPVTYTHGGNIERIPALLGNFNPSRIQIFNFDLASGEILNWKLAKEIEYIINFASESHVDRSIAEPMKFMQNNTNLMINLLEISRNISRLRNFIHISTDEVFGSLDPFVNNIEWQRPHYPSNPYSASKVAQEALAISYFKTFKLPISIINITNMIGETQNQEKFLPKVIRKVFHKEELQVDTNDLGQIGRRKYIHVEDVAEGIYKIIKSESSISYESERQNLPVKFHISGSEELSNKDVVDIVSNFMNINAKIYYAPSPRQGYDLQYQLSSEKLRKLGWSEKLTIKKRIENTVAWTLKNRKWLEIDYKGMTTN